MGVLKAGEALSVFLTPAGLYLAGVAIFYYLRGYFKHREKGQALTVGEWTTLAIAIHLCGSFADSAYWFLAWTSELKDWPPRDFLFKWGFVPNIPTRNIPLILASYCSLRAFYGFLHDRGVTIYLTERHLAIAATITFVTAWILLALP